MRTVLVALAGAIAILTLDVSSANAQVSSPRNPWCIRDGVSGSGTWDCSYHNLRQCRASARGAGGYCVRNPNYRGRKR
jgi:hypothetical protein